MVPEGRNTAASLPNRPATRSCKAFVVESSAFSSPTSASAIILRMPQKGRVEESLDRSTNAFDVIMSVPAEFRHGTCSDGRGQEGAVGRLRGAGGGAAELLSGRLLCFQYWCPTGHLAFHEHL